MRAPCSHAAYVTGYTPPRHILTNTFGHSWKILSASWKAAAFNFYIKPIKEVGDVTFFQKWVLLAILCDEMKHHTGGKNAGLISIHLSAF